MVQEACSKCRLSVASHASLPRRQKEEKAHDEKMANANARIKQAGLSSPLLYRGLNETYLRQGQIYEKKSKKGARDVPEEHTRYVNLISMLGPEMSQEK